MDNLIGSLISEAPETVAGLFERAETVTDPQAEFLKAAVARMQEMLARKTSEAKAVETKANEAKITEANAADVKSSEEQATEVKA